jgi:hypothetical protein
MTRVGPFIACLGVATCPAPSGPGSTVRPGPQGVALGYRISPRCGGDRDLPRSSPLGRPVAIDVRRSRSLERCHQRDYGVSPSEVGPRHIHHIPGLEFDPVGLGLIKVDDLHRRVPTQAQLVSVCLESQAARRTHHFI